MLDRQFGKAVFANIVSNIVWKILCVVATAAAVAIVSAIYFGWAWLVWFALGAFVVAAAILMSAWIMTRRQAKQLTDPDVIKALERKLQSTELELRSAKNSTYTLHEELRSEQKKLAFMHLEKLGRSRTLTVTVRFLEHSDGIQADYIVSLLQSTAGWSGRTVRDDGSNTRLHGSHRIECASGNRENAQSVTHILNHGTLLGELVYAREIIESGDDNLIFTIFSHSVMPR